MKNTPRIPKATDPKPVTAKITVREYNELQEQAEAENTTISALVRAAIRQRTESIQLHQELDKLRSLQEQFMLDLLGEVHNIPSAELHTIRDNLKRKMQERSYEQQ